MILFKRVNNMYNERVIENLKRIKDAKGIKQEELAKIIGVHKNTLSRWLNLETKINLDFLELITQNLNLPNNWLLNEHNMEEIKNQFSPTTLNIPFTTPEKPATPDLQQEILSKVDYLCSYCEKLEQSVTHEDLLGKIEKLLKQTTLSQTVNQMNNHNAGFNHNKQSNLNNIGNSFTLIPFPGKNRPRSFSYIPQPVGAGKTFADCEVIGTFSMELSYDADYAFRVSGMSMAPDILDGDLIFVKATKQWKERDIVIAYIKDTEEWTVKQIYYGRKNNEVALRGTWDSEYYKERDIIIQGIFKYSIRDKNLINEIIEKMEDVNG